MSETIDYNESIIMDTLKDEVCKRLGKDAWDILTEDIGIPDVRNEAKCGCHTMREFMRRFDNMVDKTTAKSILSRVRHGLRHSQFAWVQEKFTRYNNIDDFIKTCLDEEIKNFTRLRDTGESFYGQVINNEVFEFILNQPGMLAPIRKSAELHVTGFPSDMVKYLRETDERKKRYHACHCPFAKESILQENEEVSRTLCYCSLGHAKVMWEAIFSTELDGDVIRSVLNGDPLCQYVIYLPKEIIDKYV